MAEKSGFRVWDDELEREIYSAEEIVASNDRVALMGELIKARKDQDINQQDLENTSGKPAHNRVKK